MVRGLWSVESSVESQESRAISDVSFQTRYVPNDSYLLCIELIQRE